jgi:hypothetical protein
VSGGSPDNLHNANHNTIYLRVAVWERARWAGADHFGDDRPRRAAFLAFR